MTDETAASQVLFDYYTAFSSLDVRAILDYFNEPCLFLGPAGAFVVPDSETLAVMLRPVMEGLRARGYSRSELDIGQIKRLSARTVMAIGVAIRYRTDGQELERVGVTYLLQNGEAGWKIAVLVLHDADGVRP